MNSIDNLMNKYVKSFGNKKTEDLKKLSNVDVPPKPNYAPVKAICLSIVFCTILLILFTFPQKQTVPLTAIDSSKISVEHNANGDANGAGVSNHDIKSYLNDKKFHSFTKNIIIPKMDGIPAEAYALKHKNKQIGIRITVDDFLILPGITYVDAYYISKNYQITDFDNYLVLGNKSSYSSYEVFYEINNNVYFLYFESQDVYCCMQIRLSDLNKNVDVSEILKVIFD